MLYSEHIWNWSITKICNSWLQKNWSNYCSVSEFVTKFLFVVDRKYNLCQWYVNDFSCFVNLLLAGQRLSLQPFKTQRCLYVTKIKRDELFLIRMLAGVKKLWKLAGINYSTPSRLTHKQRLELQKGSKNTLPSQGA